MNTTEGNRKRRNHGRTLSTIERYPSSNVSKALRSDSGRQSLIAEMHSFKSNTCQWLLFKNRKCATNSASGTYHGVRAWPTGGSPILWKPRIASERPFVCTPKEHPSKLPSSQRRLQ